MDKIIVLDFGSQYSHLICRRIREFSVYAELVPFDTPLEKIKEMNPKGIIFSGGPSSVYNKDSPRPDSKIFEQKLPVLGICYGHQLIVDNFGGKVKRANKEYGHSTLTIDNDSSLLGGVGNSMRVWMSHGDEAENIPEGFEIIGHTERSHAAAIANKKESIYGIQFHPEVVHTENGIGILKNFVLNICDAKQEWTMESFVEKTVKEISKIDGNVLCGVSGGIDSTVAALLIHKAIGNRLKCVFVDNGLLRLDEEHEIEKMFKENFAVNFTPVNAKRRFLDKLKEITDFTSSTDLKSRMNGECVTRKTIFFLLLVAGSPACFRTSCIKNDWYCGCRFNSGSSMMRDGLSSLYKCVKRTSNSLIPWHSSRSNL